MGLLRFLLAVTVIAAHQGSLFGLRFIGNGITAVECFFIISGFYMALVLDTKYSQTWTFYYNRAVRIYPLYFFCLGTYLCGAAAYFVATGTWLGGLSTWSRLESWTGTAGPLIANSIIFGADTLHLLPKASGIRGAELVLLPAIWSLSVELQYYLLAPWLMKFSNAKLGGVCCLSILLRLWFRQDSSEWPVWLYYFLPSQLVFFICGAWGFRFYRNYLAAGLTRPRVALAGTILLAAAICLSGNLGLTYDTRWFLIVPFATLIPWVFALCRNNHWDRALGEWSYPLYLTHAVVESLYTPARHFVPAGWKAEAILGASVALSGVAILLDRQISARLKLKDPGVREGVPKLGASAVSVLALSAAGTPASTLKE